MMEKIEFSYKDIILLSISLINSILSPIIVAIIVGTGRFSGFNLTPLQVGILLFSIVIFIVTTAFLILKRQSTINFLKLLLKILTLTWPFIGGVILLLVTLWGVYVINSYWIMLNLLGFTVAVIMLSLYFDRRKRYKNTINETKFISITIPPGVGNKYFGNFYIDAPSGDVALGGIFFHLDTETLVFDTNGQIHEYHPRDDGCKEVILTLNKSVKFIKAIHILINSGNSKRIYASEKIGEIKLLFNDAPTITIDLILGTNIREWCIGAQGNFVRELSSPHSKVVWQGVNKDGTYAVIDCLKIPVYETVKTNVLEKIVFVHKPLQRQEDALGVHYFVSAITAEIASTKN